jgi:hypothetical protein
MITERAKLLLHSAWPSRPGAVDEVALDLLSSAVNHDVWFRTEVDTPRKTLAPTRQATRTAAVIRCFMARLLECSEDFVEPNLVFREDQHLIFEVDHHDT